MTMEATVYSRGPLLRVRSGGCGCGGVGGAKGEGGVRAVGGGGGGGGGGMCMPGGVAV